MEYSENIGPKYAILGDLRHWHIVTARCFKCRHERTEFTGDFIAWERPPHTYLTELQRKLRCTQCGNRAGNMLTVRMAARNRGSVSLGASA